MEKEQFDAGIKKCEKLITILLPQNIFKVQGMSEFLLALDLEKSLIKRKDERMKNIRRRKMSEAPKKKSSEAPCKNVQYLTELTSKLERQNCKTWRANDKSFKQILKVLTKGDYSDANS